VLLAFLRVALIPIETGKFHPPRLYRYHYAYTNVNIFTNSNLTPPVLSILKTGEYGAAQTIGAATKLR
jgi:hypothetical protein